MTEKTTNGFNLKCDKCGLGMANCVNGRCICGAASWHGAAHAIYGAIHPTQEITDLRDENERLRRQIDMAREVLKSEAPVLAALAKR